MADNRAFDAGYDAFRNGVAVEDNPYDGRAHADAFESRVKGWRESQKQEFDENARRG
jgi:hypothetical protein